jgi:hypothetical protein
MFNRFYGLLSLAMAALGLVVAIGMYVLPR